MSNNNVRGPTSALTEFLRASGITPTTVARRAATRNADQPTAGPSNAQNDEGGDDDVEEAQGTKQKRRKTRVNAVGYASDELDEPEGAAEPEPQPTKKRKLTKAAEAKLKAKEKEKTKKGKQDDEDEDEDAYTALSKSMWSNTLSSKPAIGNFEDCATCGKQFTVTKYTMAANPGPGYLCHPCAKSSGTDPFKKPALPKRKKAPVDKRNVVSFEERRFPSLVSMCVQLITKHINDVEALGDIGSINMEAISKALSKNRSLTPENALLFYNVQNTTLTLYDATNLLSPALSTLAHLNPCLTSLRLDFCGHLDNDVMATFNTSLPHLMRIQLLGPFLVRAEAWKAFFETHPNMDAFLITQSPRFDLECMQSLVQHCGETLRELRLKEVGKLDDQFLAEIVKLGNGNLTLLDLSDPSTSCSEEAMIEVLKCVGGTLLQLDLSKHGLLTDEFLDKGVKPHVCVLESLTLMHLPELTDKGVGQFFETWSGNPPLREIRMGRNSELGSEALTGILSHSGERVEVLDVNGWKEVGEEALMSVGRGRFGAELRKVDVGWCREVNDFVIKAWMEGEDQTSSTGCRKLEEVKVWGCNRITERCPRKRGVNIFGIESH